MGRLPAQFHSVGTGSFSDFLTGLAPHLAAPAAHASLGNPSLADTRHGTTIVAGVFPGGVVMAGDRRATMGNLIAQRDIEKVFHGDEFSAVGIAGTAGLAIEMVRLFQVELEHYEKLEGTLLSLDGKANKLATMIRANLGMALQGLVVVPLFAGFDTESKRGRIFSYDTVGGTYEVEHYHSVGSGSLFAKSALKKLWRDDFNETDAVRAAIQALYDAADDDSATGGPDVTRRIYPVVAVVSAAGYRKFSEAQVGEHVQAVLSGRMERPGGPQAPVA